MAAISLYNAEGHLSKRTWEGIVAPRESWPRQEESATSPNEIKNWGHRVRVRIIGVHPKDKQDLPDDQLPWAEVRTTTMGSGHKGTGLSMGITQGTWVEGIWDDPDNKSGPIILGIKANKSTTPLVKEQPTTNGFKQMSGFTNDDLVPTDSIPASQGQPIESNINPNLLAAGDTNMHKEATIGLAQPSECEKIPMGEIQKSIIGMQQDIERAQDQLKKWENTTTGWIEDKQEYIKDKQDIAANFVSRGMKWMMKEQRKNLMETINKETKALYHDVNPLDRDKVKAAKDTTLELLSCVYSNVTKNLFKMVGDFLGKIMEKYINVPMCAIENFVGGLVGNLLGTIGNMVDSIMGRIASILGSSFSIADSILGLVDQLVGFFKCDDAQECPEANEWDIFDGGQPAATFNVDNILNQAKEVTSNASKLMVDFDTLKNFSLDNVVNAGVSAANQCNVGPLFCGPPTVEFWGGGLEAGASGHARGNAIVSAAGDILGVDIIASGLGYRKQPFVTIKDNCGKGKGVTARANIQTDGGIDPNTGQPTFSVGSVTISEEGFGYPNKPDGDMGGDGRVWADKNQTIVKRVDGKWERFDPDEEIPNVDTTTPNVDGGVGDQILKPEDRNIVGVDDSLIGPGGTITPTMLGGGTGGTGAPEGGGGSLSGIGDDGDQPQADRIARRKGVTPIAGTGPNGETDFNAFPNLSVGSYPVVLYLCGMEIENSGLNYTSTDQIVISPNDAGAEVRPTFGPWGVLTKVEIINGGSGWTERPNIYIRSQTGYNAVIVPRFCIQRVGDDTEGDIPAGTPTLSVIDCVGEVNRGEVDPSTGYRIIESK
tara:strand:- start:1918 stop:4395 length:2478 start_codon:yes stop_codon:yes gene_type:complete